MVAVVHRRQCLQHLACCSVNSRHIGSESRFLPTPPAFDAPVRGFSSKYRHPVWYGKTRIMWLPDGENISKLSLFVLTQITNVTEIQTPHDGIGRAYASHRAAKITQGHCNWYHSKVWVRFPICIPKRDIGRKSRFFHISFAFDDPISVKGKEVSNGILLSRWVRKN